MLYVYKLLIATPQPSIQSDPIPSEVSGSTDSTLEQVPTIVSELIDLVAAIGLPVDVHKCMTKASLQLQCDPRGIAGILTEQKLISDCRYRVIESSSLVPVLFREVFSHPYISFFHLLVNGFSVTCFRTFFS